MLPSKLRYLAFLLPLLVGLGCSADGWTSLDDLDELRELFNRDRGNARIVLLLSPT